MKSHSFLTHRLLRFLLLFQSRSAGCAALKLSIKGQKAQSTYCFNQITIRCIPPQMKKVRWQENHCLYPKQLYKGILSGKTELILRYLYGLQIPICFTRHQKKYNSYR